ncbi:unnamed protein product [Prorocentrum cordatum]|uniref:FDX-ACB domain-containing protein n=1 Tax=Prorocentrum cordatum TaxID=2364126 RepID=A0ABN9W283_9DINO|nr:unnamed protein product [Polarella glacialis]
MLDACCALARCSAPVHTLAASRARLPQARATPAEAMGGSSSAPAAHAGSAASEPGAAPLPSQEGSSPAGSSQEQEAKARPPDGGHGAGTGAAGAATPAIEQETTAAAGAAPAHSRRLARIEATARQRVAGVRIVLEDLQNDGNRAAILRSVESLGLLYVEEVVPTADPSDDPLPDAGPPSATTKPRIRRRDPRAKQTSIVNGAEKWLHVTRHSSVNELQTKMEALGIPMLAAMPMPDQDLGEPEDPGKALPRRSHVALCDVDFRPKGGVALVFGSEGRGISGEMLAACGHRCFSIPTPGMTESLNVSVTVALCAFWAREARLSAVAPASGGTSTRATTDLDAGAAVALQEHYRRLSGEHNFVRRVKRGDVKAAARDATGDAADQPGPAAALEPRSRCPPFRRDISMWIPDAFVDSDLLEVIRGEGGDQVEAVDLIDEFTDGKTGRKSKAFRVVWRDSSRALTSEEVNARHGAVLKRVVGELAVELR